MTIINNISIESIQQTANNGDTHAMTNLGLAYFRGINTEQSNEKSLYWVSKAAELGNDEALYTLGVFHFDGLAGVAKDTDKACDLCRQAAAQGHGEAMVFLGLRCMEADDYAQAEQWFLRADANDSVSAKSALGKLYGTEGWDGHNQEKSQAYLHIAAEDGDIEAMTLLGLDG